MTTQHKWADIIKAWADGKTVQFQSLSDGPTKGRWIDFQGEGDDEPEFGPWSVDAGRSESLQWRVKPEPVTRWINIYEGWCSDSYETKAGADAGSARDTQRLACIEVSFMPGEGLQG